MFMNTNSAKYLLEHLFVDGLPARTPALRPKRTALVKRMYACLYLQS